MAVIRTLEFIDCMSGVGLNWSIWSIDSMVYLKQDCFCHN